MRMTVTLEKSLFMYDETAEKNSKDFNRIPQKESTLEELHVNVYLYMKCSAILCEICVYNARQVS